MSSNLKTRFVSLFLVAAMFGNGNNETQFIPRPYDGWTDKPYTIFQPRLHDGWTDKSRTVFQSRPHSYDKN